jgi:cytoskeletal protein RodZ
MSNPISTVEDASQDIVEDVATEPENEIEVDQNLDANALPPILEVDPIEDSSAESSPLRENRRTNRIGLLALVLAVLLFGSIAINLQQARVTAALNAENQSIEFALNEAVNALDRETARADSAESTLTEIGAAVDTVNDRIESLRQALGELREATAY